MQIDVSPAELEVLEDILSSQLGDLKEQIYKAEVADYKAQLKRRETLVVGLLERVKALRARPTTRT
jgi:hypothetical protein